MDSNVKFSIIVPVYKVENYIAECIESVLKQTYPDFELLLVDDGSPDKSGDICEDYAAGDARIKVFHKENGGQISARCLGLDNAAGDYCIFLDSDDYIAPETLEVLHGYIKEHDADCIIYGFNWLKSSGTEKVRCREEYCGELIRDKAMVLNIILNDAAYNAIVRKCVRRSIADSQGMEQWHHLRHGEDLLQSLGMIEKAESFLFIPELLYYYRVNTGSVTHSISYDGYKADFSIYSYTMEMLKRLGLFSESDYNRRRNFALDSLAIELKRISRFCSNKGEMYSAFDCIRADTYYKSFLSHGYRKAPALPGVVERSGIRRLFNRLLIALLKAGRYDAIIFISRNIYK